MGRINLEVSELGRQIKNLSSTGSEIAGVAFSVDKGEAQLDSFEKYIECINELNDAFSTFGAFIQKDATGFEAVRQQFISDDDFWSRIFTAAND